MKKYLLICLIPLLNLSHAKGDFLISDNFTFWLFAIPIGIIFIIFMLFVSVSINSIEYKKDEDNKENNDQ
jgi:hypothetical protein